MEKMEVFPYEVLLRFSCDNGEIAGQLRGVHLIEKRYIVDDDNKIVGRVERGDDNPRPFTREEIAEYLGANLAGVLSQHQSLNADIDSMKAELQSHTATIRSLTDERNNLQGILSHIQKIASA